MADTQMIEQLEAEQSMFVQTAQGMRSDGKTLTLEGVTLSTLYFSDRRNASSVTWFIDPFGRPLSPVSVCGVRRRERRRDRRRL